MVGMSRSSGSVVLPAVASDIVSVDRVVRVCCGVAAQGEGTARINMLDAVEFAEGKNGRCVDTFKAQMQLLLKQTGD
jgi:hypothetical protein